MTGINFVHYFFFLSFSMVRVVPVSSDCKSTLRATLMARRVDLKSYSGISVLTQPWTLLSLDKAKANQNINWLHSNHMYVVTSFYFWAGELEVNKCAFKFLSEIRQIQCTRAEFWCIQCPRPSGPSALDKHQIQASALDLSYFTSKSKCKFINLIHTRQKNKIICSCSWKK